MQLHRPYLLINRREAQATRDVEILVSFLGKDALLNVAGPRESTTPGIYEYVQEVIRRLLAKTLTV